jgi:hypothetical protein
LAAKNVDEAAQSITSILEVLTVDAVIRAPNLGSQTIERGVQDLSERNGSRPTLCATCMPLRSPATKAGKTDYINARSRGERSTANNFGRSRPAHAAVSAAAAR